MGTETLNNAAQALHGIRQGQFMAEVDEQLADLLQRIRTTGKKGSLVIELVVEPHKKVPGAVVATGTAKMKPPTMDSEGTLLYLTEDGRFSTRNPRQPDLLDQVRAVPERDEPVKTVDATTA